MRIGKWYISIDKEMLNDPMGVIVLGTLLAVVICGFLSLILIHPNCK